MALAAVQRLDHGRNDVHDQYGAAGLREGDGERQTDVAGADDGNVVRHRGAA
jgi:hypothetical protein